MVEAGHATKMGSTTSGSVAAACSFREDFVFDFFVDGAPSEAFMYLHFLASASAALVFFSSEAAEGTLGFEPVMLAGNTMLGASYLGASVCVATDFFCLVAILGSIPGRPRALRFLAALCA